MFTFFYSLPFEALEGVPLMGFTVFKRDYSLGLLPEQERLGKVQQCL